MLLRVPEVKFVKQVCGYKELATATLLQACPRREEIWRYLPDITDLSKIDRKYAMNAT